MRLIYTDEAGISDKEPITVVASVIIDGDREYLLLKNEISRIVYEHVPSELRDKFWIHACEIFSGGKSIDRNLWPFEQRLDFLKEIACLPFVHDIPIAFAFDRKDLWKESKFRFGLSVSKWSHLMAFKSCMDRADHFMRHYLHGNEIAVVVCEDTQEMRGIIEKYGLLDREISGSYPMIEIKPEKYEIDMGVKKNFFRPEIRHIIDTPFFAKKRAAPILQLADVCAFILRRYVVGKDHGEDLVKAMLGPLYGPEFVDEPNWLIGWSSGLANVESFWPDMKKKNRELWRIRRAMGLAE